MSKTPVPNRNIEVPKSLYDMLEKSWTSLAYNPAVQLKRIKYVLAYTYSCGYVDGYRDGHDDAGQG